MLQAIFVCLCLVASLIAEDLGTSMTATATVPIAPKCNSPVLLQQNPEGAFGNTVYLVAWSDGRQQPIVGGADIYCARIEAVTGRVLDSNGILVCHAPDIQNHPAVAFDGTNFLIVWEDIRNRNDYDIYGARVSESGQLLDATPFLISGRQGKNEVRPTVAFTGGNFLVAWAGVKADPVYGIYGCRVSSAGTVLDPQGIEIAVETDARINAVKPASGRYMGYVTQHMDWWHSLSSNTFPVLVTRGNKCLLVYNGGKKFGLVDPATGAILKGPVSPPSWNHVDIVGACVGVTRAQNDGWMINSYTMHGGWSKSGGYKAFRVDSALGLDSTSKYIPYEKEEDYVDAQGSTTIGSTRGGFYYFKPAAGLLASSALLAIEFAANDGSVKGRTGERYNSYIILNRLGFSDTTYLEGQTGIHLDKNLGLSGIYVSKPAVCNGPNRECLLVYQRYAGSKNCLIVSKIIREK